MERLELYVGVPEVGYSEQVAVPQPAGQAVVRDTLLAYPLSAVTVTVEEPGLLRWIRAAVALIEKSALVEQLLNLKEPIRVYQPALEVTGKYSFTYQKVQSSPGSMRSDV